jgi:peroxiredoxin
MKKILAAFTVTLGFISSGWCEVEHVNAKQFLSSTLWDANGKPIALEGLKGKKVMINFYASWCTGCREEIKDINKIKSDSAGKMEVIGVSLDNDIETVRNFAARTGMGYFSLVSGSMGPGIMRSLGNEKKAVPYTVIVEKNGQISFSKLGLLNKDDLVSIKNKAIEQ